MLVKIESDIFREKEINFHQGLNVVLGDNKGSNSIGKSTLLMVIDFVLGGKTYLSHNNDVVANLGHHFFTATFKFNDRDYCFTRGTENPDTVSEKNLETGEVKDIPIKDYTKDIKDLYSLDSETMNLRTAVNTFSRIWGKDNYDVKYPIHGFSKETNRDAILKLIKIFDRYDEIEEQVKELKLLNKQKSILNNAGTYKLIPKINKRDFIKNQKEIEDTRKEIERIGKTVASPSGDIDEIVSDEMISLREEKNKLLESKEFYISRLARINRTIKKAAVAEFEPLLEFFDDVNLKKLQEIEQFHLGISKILSEELENARNNLIDKIQKLEQAIDEALSKQEKLLTPNKEVNLFIDTLIDLSTKIKSLESENQYYTKRLQIAEEIKSKDIEFGELKEKIIENIQSSINSKLKEINDLIHENKRTAPELNLSYASYNYKFFDNNGTGKAYTNLIIFDLAILTLTKLPFIIHDSFLFKNIEKETVEKIIEFYNGIDKQVFIAIDFIDIYNKETQGVLKSKKVIELSEDKLLTGVDWRDKKIEGSKQDQTIEE